MGLIPRDLIGALVLLSLFITYLITPPSYESIDDEMRSYVKEAAEFLGWREKDFASHIQTTSSWANQSFFNNGRSSFYIVIFDETFVRTQPQNIRKAIAGHEVGHAYFACEDAYIDYYYGYGTYLDVENCADVISVMIFGFDGNYAALKEIKKASPKATDIDLRIELLYSQFGSLGVEKDLTQHLE